MPHHRRRSTANRSAVCRAEVGREQRERNLLTADARQLKLPFRGIAQVR